LEKDTFSDASVVTEMGDILCFNIDLSLDPATNKIKDAVAEELAERFHVKGLPALFFLEPDGQLREFVSGYLPPEPFLAEVKRIKRDEKTIGSMRRGAEAAPDDLELRYELAMRLRKVGDIEGHREQLDEIARRDPDGKSVAARRVSLDEILRVLEKDLNPDALYAFLAGEKEPGLLFWGWRAVWKFEAYLFRDAKDQVEADEHRALWLAASRELWKHVPEDRVGAIGNGIAWGLYEYHKKLGPEDHAFALQVAEVAARAAQEDANVQDTLACCLFVVGERERAIQAVRRCIELEPENPSWKKRLAEFRRSRP